MARAALRQLDQLQTHRRAGDMAAVARAAGLAWCRSIADPPAYPYESGGLMGWVGLVLLLALSLAALWLFGVRGGLLKATAAALLLGASGYALQGQPDV